MSDRASRRQAEQARARKLELRHVGLAVAGAVLVMAIVAAAFALGPALAAARGHGTNGTFLVSNQVCNRGCTWVGTFRSASGQVTPDLAYQGVLPDGAGPGSSIPAILPPGSRTAFARHGSIAWVTDLLVTLMIGGAVGFTLWISPLPVGRRRERLTPPGARTA
jgi:hypothetical protein